MAVNIIAISNIFVILVFVTILTIIIYSGIRKKNKKIKKRIGLTDIVKGV
jgi:hypothetical protein